MVDTLLFFAGLYPIVQIDQKLIFQTNNSFVEVAIGVMCSSMPAMASFGKLHVFQKRVFTFVPSRLLPHKGSKRSEDVKVSKRKHLVLPSSFAKNLHVDPFTQLRDDQSIYSDDVVFLRSATETSTQVGEPSANVESGQIGKPVTVEQCSEKA